MNKNNNQTAQDNLEKGNQNFLDSIPLFYGGSNPNSQSTDINTNNNSSGNQQMSESSQNSQD